MAKECPKAHGVLVKIQLKLEIMNSWGPASPVLCFFPAAYQCRHSEGQMEAGGGEWGEDTERGPTSRIVPRVG